ncbi:hypothetical protein TNCV_369171 [Trichonephila clavipes]|nr:hypothetical protein TNCV_369171 [Trichonephila clavipes]
MSSPRFETRPNDTAASITNHYTGWVDISKSKFYKVVANNDNLARFVPAKRRSTPKSKCDLRSQVVKVTDLWPVGHEFEPSTAEDPPCRGTMHVKSVESSNVLPWCSVVRRGGASSGVILVS